MGCIKMVKVWIENKNRGSDADNDIIDLLVKEYNNVIDVMTGDKDVITLMNGDTFGFSVLELVRILKTLQFKMPLQDLFDLIKIIYDYDLVRFEWCAMNKFYYFLTGLSIYVLTLPLGFLLMFRNPIYFLNFVIVWFCGVSYIFAKSANKKGGSIWVTGTKLNLCNRK